MWKRRKICKRARELDECFWAIQVLSQRSLDLLSNVCGGSGYLVWWQISDANHRLMKCCEIMVRLVSHESLLKTNDVRLKGSPAAARFCNSCNLAAMDDARNLIMQCPAWQEERTDMMREISVIPDGSGHALLESQCDLVYVLMGKSAKGCTFEQMVIVWSISARYITRMYNRRIKEGIG